MTIKINAQTMTKHADNIESSVESMTYLPMKEGNMPYTQSNSINNFRQALRDFLEAIEDFQETLQSDSDRIDKIGKSTATMDEQAGQAIAKGMD
ncbi:DUF3130 family protein [Listeria immobilis]|uniref:DUF3130 family protein n=1 Tax=Listeria immobilis TaxID=2713502 RepID=UPI0016267ECF|nr:DUF3130 family protein [Listeria immobilis]MBC1516668.1 DUF3130 family protein [Listeria immobilis]